MSTLPANSLPPLGPANGQRVRSRWLGVVAFVLAIAAFLADAGFLSDVMVAIPLGLAAITVGIVVLRSSRPGKNLARLGIVLGGLAALAAFNVNELRLARMLSRASICYNQMHTIGVAISKYRDDHEGNSPASLTELIGVSGVTPSILQCPLAHGRRSYDYFYRPPSDATDTSVIIACDLILHPTGTRCVLRSDGAVAIERDAAFQKDLAQPENAAFAQAFAAAPKPVGGG